MTGAGQPTTYRVAATVISTNTEMREGERDGGKFVFLCMMDIEGKRVFTHVCTGSLD